MLKKFDNLKKGVVVKPSTFSNIQTPKTPKIQSANPSATKVIKKLVGSDEKMKKVKACWENDFVLIKVEPPQLITNEKMRKKYSVRLTYLGKNHVKRNKTVYFGDKEKPDYIDHKDNAKKMSIINRLKNSDSPFSKDFWRLNLLNNKETISESYSDVLTQLNIL
jgi:hypothetical protein